MQSPLSRLLSPSASTELAALIDKLFASSLRAAPKQLTVVPPPPEPQGTDSGPKGQGFGPNGLGTAASRVFKGYAAAAESTPFVPAAPYPSIPTAPNDVATLLAPTPQQESPAAETDAELELYCPPAVRDDVALGEEVNERLVEWAQEVGIYPGQTDRLRAANFGRLIMLTHPATSDVDRLLAATKCVVAEWATDDHFLDDESLGADADMIGSRLAVAYASIAPVDLPSEYAPQAELALQEEPVSVAYQAAFRHLSRYATASQVARLQHELAVMLMAYNHEANWRSSGRIPPVWEYLLHRNENSFLPPMALVDAMAGYELPPHEFAHRRVRRLFALAGNASVLLNDVYSKSKETDDDFDLIKVIMAEDGTSQTDAVRKAVELHNELMHTYETEAAALASVGTPALARFLADIWAWLGGNREWHATTRRYNDPI
ncbi:MAG: family 2 encapsulin nanocompartment cargo protein terpene cyclase [Actinomycetota bacterium]